MKVLPVYTRRREFSYMRKWQRHILVRSYATFPTMGALRAAKTFLRKIAFESKGPAVQENVVQENITSTHPAIVMSEIPLESLFDDIASKDVEVFVEKGSNDAETKEVKPSGVTTTSTRIVTTSRTVVKNDGSPVTTVEKNVIVNGEEQPVDTSLLSPPVEPEVVDEKAEEGSEEGGDKGEVGEKEEAEGNEGGKPRQKVKKKKSFKKTFQGMMHRRSKADKDEDEEKS